MDDPTTDPDAQDISSSYVEVVEPQHTLSELVRDAIVNSDCFCKPGDPTCSDWVDSEHRWNSIHTAVMHVIGPISENSNLVRHAKRELELIGEEPETIEGLLKVIQAFADMGHSGGSASVCIPWINTLLQFKNIKPLTNDPTEWMHHGPAVWGEEAGIWQNIRNSEAFSNDGGKTYYLLSEGGSNINRRPIHKSYPAQEGIIGEVEYTFCGSTEDEAVCACGCSGYDERCPLYLHHYHGITQVPTSHICCKIPGRD